LKYQSHEFGEQEYTNNAYREYEVDFRMRLFEAGTFRAEKILEKFFLSIRATMIEIFIVLKHCCIGEHEKANN